MDPIFWVKFNQCWAQSLDFPGPGPKMIGPSAPQLKLAVACDLKRLLIIHRDTDRFPKPASTASLYLQGYSREEWLRVHVIENANDYCRGYECQWFWSPYVFVYACSWVQICRVQLKRVHFINAWRQCARDICNVQMVHIASLVTKTRKKDIIFL